MYWVHLPEVTYGKNGYRIWGITHRNDMGKMAGQMERDVCGKTD